MMQKLGDLIKTINDDKAKMKEGDPAGCVISLCLQTEMTQVFVLIWGFMMVSPLAVNRQANEPS